MRVIRNGEAEDVSIETAGKRHFRSRQERRQIVEETLQPGASVAVVARQHAVNANMVFRWRKLYREGLLDGPTSVPELLPVRLSTLIAKDPQVPERAISSVLPGVIHIEIGNARVRIEGAPDPDCVRAAIESLRQ